MTSTLTNANRPSTGKTSYHRDGSVTYWSVYSQTWQRTSHVSDAELAAMGHDERERVLRHMGRAQLAAQPAPAHDDCDIKGSRSLTCRACAAHVDVRDCDLCPECGEVPSHYHCGDLRPIPSLR